MSRRRQRRFSLAPSPERPPPAHSPSPPSPTHARPRPKSWSARGPLLRRHPAPVPPPSSPPPSAAKHYVPVRVRDFVTVPPARLAPPALALGPIDTASRPPSYDLTNAVKRKTRRRVATQTAPDWDAIEVDRLLDDECQSEVSQEEPHQVQEERVRLHAPPVFMIHDRTHVNRLVTIVNAAAEDHQRNTSAASAAQRALVTSIDRAGAFSSASSSEMSTTSSCIAGTASPCSARSTSARSTSAHATSASFGSSSTKSDPPPPSHALVALPPPRRKLLNSKKIPSPVKYTFRPPVPAPPKPLSPLPPAGAVRCEDRGEMAGVASVVPVALPYRYRRDSYGGLSALSSGPPSGEPVTLAQVKGVVDAVDPRVVLNMASPPLLAVSIFRKTSKRESDESGRSSGRSSSTEYFEDEYTKFIEKKNGSSPLRLRGKPYLAKMIPSEAWGSKGGRMDCRSNSTVSVATSDDEYHPISVRLSNVSARISSLSERLSNA